MSTDATTGGNFPPVDFFFLQKWKVIVSKINGLKINIVVYFNYRKIKEGKWF